MSQDLSQIDYTIIKVKQLTTSTQIYINDHLLELCNDWIVPEIQSISLGMNMPKGFADGVKAVQSGKNRVKIINTWGTPEKPLAKWFNYGTKDHGPKIAPLLHWIDKRTGKHIYAKWVRGVPKTNAMEIGIKAGWKRMLEALLQNTKDKVQEELDL